MCVLFSFIILFFAKWHSLEKGTTVKRTDANIFCHPWDQMTAVYLHNWKLSPSWFMTPRDFVWMNVCMKHDDVQFKNVVFASRSESNAKYDTSLVLISSDQNSRREWCVSEFAASVFPNAKAVARDKTTWHHLFLFWLTNNPFKLSDFTTGAQIVILEKCVSAWKQHVHA